MPTLNVDRVTTLIGLIPSVFVLVRLAGVDVPVEAEAAVSAIVIGAISFYVGKPLKVLR